MTSNRNNSSSTPMAAGEALVRLGALCAAGEQCEADLRDKMRRWGVPGAEADGVIARLVAEGYISEERYAHAFVRDKLAFNGWGPRKIAYALAQKRISRPVADAALAEVSHEQWAETLERLLSAKARLVAGRDPRKARAALLRFAASRGFDASMTYPLLDALCGADDE